VAGPAARVIHRRQERETHLEGNKQLMNLAAEIVLGIVVFLTAALVFALFVWASIKDGAEDRAVQARLGIRRRTRLGR
jgi:hypothetical protein